MYLLIEKLLLLKSCHYCLPSKIWNQIVPQIYGHWNGDVWKAIVEARTMKDIDTCEVMGAQWISSPRAFEGRYNYERVAFACLEE